jgi:hypothetical protein
VNKHGENKLLFDDDDDDDDDLDISQPETLY